MNRTEINTESGQRILLLDLDNCPQHLARLPMELDRFSRIIACYGAVEPRLGLSLVRSLATAIHEGRLEFVGMRIKGKNAADFGLAFWAGRLLTETPPDTEFVILSGDQDLDHVVDLLHRENRRAQRVGKAGEPAEANNGKAIREYVTDRLRPEIQRPKRRQSLLNSIRSFFQNQVGIDPNGVLNELIVRGVVQIDEQGVVTYRDGDLWRDEEPLPF
jgi:hypothetical protein